MRPAKVSGIVAEDAMVSYWPIFSLGPNIIIPRSLCESKSTQFLSRF